MPAHPKTKAELLKELTDLQLENKSLKNRYEQDIIERLAVEEALRESEQKLYNIFASSPDAITITDLNGIIIDCNQATAGMLNYSSVEDLIGKNSLALITAKDKQIAADNMQRVFDKSIIKNLEYRLLKRDGSEFPAEMSVSLIRDEYGKPVSFVAITKDITERKLAEEALIESNEKFSSIFENNSAAMAIFESDTTISMVNKEYCKLSGYSKEEVIGMSWTKQIPSADLERLKEYNRLRLANSKDVPNNYEFSFCKKNGEVRYSLMSVCMFKDKRIIASFNDITDRKRAEVALKESEERFRAIFEQAAVGSAVLNTKTGQFIRINQKYCDFVGYTMQEMLQKTFMDVTYNEDVQFNIDKNFMLMQDGGREYSFEKRYVHKNGNIIWGNITISPLWKAGEKPETFFHIAIVEDITERKRTELIIQEQNKQLHDLNATKDKFFSVIAHDLKSPFLGFLGLTESLAEETSLYSAQDIAQLGKEMHKAADNLYSLLNNLLEWAQMQKDSMSFQPKEFTLSHRIAENVESIKKRSEKKGIEIINRVTGFFQVYADPNMINSVLLNLLSNAVKFTSRNGTVSINAKKNDNEMVEISVSDNGIGIPKDIIDKLFMVGEKTSQKGTDGELSSGLGILLCKEFVEKNGGKIWVESEVGKGSTFYFTLKSHG